MSLIRTVRRKYRLHRLNRYINVPFKIDSRQNLRFGSMILIRGNVQFGVNCFVNDFSRFRTGKNSHIFIGDNVVIASNVEVSAINRSLTNPQEYVEGDITIGQRVFVGSNAFVKHGVNIGNHAIVGANTVITHDIPPHTVAVSGEQRIIHYLLE